MDMMSTGVRTPVGIRVVASASRLEALGTIVAAVAARVPGARSAVFESLGGETRPAFALDPAALAQHRVDASLANSTADLLLSGGQVGDLRLDGNRLRIRIAPQPDSMGRAADPIRDVTVRSASEGGGQPVPMGLLGHPTFVTGPASVRTENGQPVAYVFVDLDEGADLLSYREAAQREVDRAIDSGELPLAAGERIEWTGEYELMTAAKDRLRWIVPAVAFSMLGLLLVQFRSLAEALIVLVSVPFALVGSLWTLFLCGYSLSAPVWVGLLSALGLAMQTAVVMVVYIDQAFHRSIREGRLKSREDVILAHAEGTVQRLRPKVMTITTMAAGLLPLLWAEGAGAEIMKRVAAPMVGGLATSAFLTLEVLPVLYTLWRCRQLARAQRTGLTIDRIVGAPPAWARQ
jgi:Cu(I)/Ag(I) efflux system membrane protein CusA/SilA